MSYREGITVDGKHSFADFGLNISSRKIDLPPKNSIRKTIPYMSGFYDFTTLNGVVTFGERTISYTFDIIGATVQEMDRKRTEVVNWFCNMHDVDIYDDTIPDYHFYGSFDSVSQNEDGEKTELTITFVCYPFMIANEPVQMLFNEARTDTVIYEGQPVSIYGKGKATLKMDGSTITLNSAEMIDTGLVLTAGEKQIEVVPTELLTYPYSKTTKTTNGITFTDNGDGTITASGTATATAYFELQTVQLEVGQYYLKGCPLVANLDGLRLVADEIGGNKKRYGQDVGRGSEFSVDKALSVGVFIAVDTGRTLSNVTFDPSLISVPTLKYIEEVL
jgi:hypothetical protein